MLAANSPQIQHLSYEILAFDAVNPNRSLHESTVSRHTGRPSYRSLLNRHPSLDPSNA